MAERSSRASSPPAFSPPLWVLMLCSLAICKLGICVDQFQAILSFKYYFFKNENNAAMRVSMTLGSAHISMVFFLLLKRFQSDGTDR